MATEPERVELPVVAKPFGSTSVFVERMDFDLVFVTLGNRMEEGWCEAFRVVDALRQTHFEPILNAKANQLKKEAENATSRVYWWDNVLYELGFYRRCDRVEESTVNLPRLLDQVLRVLEEAKEIATAKGVGTTEASLSDLSKQIHEARKTQHEVLKFRSELGLALQEYRGTLSFRLVSRVYTLTFTFLTSYRAPSTGRWIRMTLSQDIKKALYMCWWFSVIL